MSFRFPSSRRKFVKTSLLVAGAAVSHSSSDLLAAWREKKAVPIDSALTQRLNLMPKAEIHVHLEGTMSPETVWELAQENHVALPADSLEKWRTYYKFQDFAHFIDTYVVACRAIAKPEDFTYIIDKFARGQAAQNTLYTEVFFSPSLHLGRFPETAILDALEQGMRNARKKHNVRLQFIPDITRERPDWQNAVLRFALKGRDRGICIGMGLGGREAEYPPELFRGTFAEARRKGLHVVAHAGEVAGAKSIWGALNALHAERIGHGIRCLEDRQLVQRLKQTAIPLEVCPVSNYRTEVVPAGKPHPIRALLDHGLLCTLNSDDPAMFGTSLTNEYHTLAAQGFTWNELWALNRATLNASFLDDSERKQLRVHWDEFERWRGLTSPVTTITHSK